MLQAIGDAAAVEYSVSASGNVYGSGSLSAGENVRVGDLYMGNYIVTLNLPEDVLLTGLNGYPSLQRRTAQWLVTIKGGKESLYQIELSKAGAISGTIEGCDGTAAVTVSGSEQFSVETDGSFRVGGLVPDTYTVTVVLPPRQFTGDGWTFTAGDGQTLATMTVEVKDGGEILLPTIVRREMGRVSGSIYSEQGRLMVGVNVELLNAAGEVIAATVTNQSGQWQFAELENGTYSVRYASVNDTVIPGSTVQISDENMYPMVEAHQVTPTTMQLRVFVDENNNGAQAKNEPRLSGAIITLLALENGGRREVTSAVTDAEGMVVLQAPAGEYTLRCELPEDYGFAKKGDKLQLNSSLMEQSVERIQETHITLTADGETAVGIGATHMATLRGTVWLDENGDGLWQSDEQTIEGMKVAADGTRNGLHYETLTDAEGRFEIRQIKNGTYNVTYYVPDGYTFTVKASGAKQLRSLMTTEADREGVDQVVFDAGEVIDEQNIGLMKEAVIEGICFLDANYNGYFDEGEAVLPGVELELLRQSNNKRLQTVTSDENGVYRFGNVRGDTFKIKALLPTGATYTINIDGDENANQFAPRNGRREQTVTDITVASGESVRVMLGAIRYGSIAGVVYLDDNFSGDWETGEKIVSGVTLTLLDAEGQELATARTDKNGRYAFEQIAPGSYRLLMEAEKGYAFTKLGSGNVLENTGSGMGISELIEVALDENVTGVNIGMMVPAQVTGVVFADANDNGLYNTDEKGLKGTVVSLMKESGIADSTEVAEDGTFTFDAVFPGRYYLRYELPDNGVFSPRVAGGNAVVGEGSSGAGDWFELDTGDVWHAPVCGGLDLGVISGTAFGDSNGNGTLDENETAKANMVLTLTPSRSDLTEMTVVTGVDGCFLFEGLRPDTYTLTVKCPDGYVASRMEGVALGIVHGVAVQTVEVVVGMGSAWTEQQIGCVLPAAYDGIAWLDENLNGRYDEGERPAAGEKLAIISQTTGELVAEMTTDENGSFLQQGLAPGMYTLRYELADGVRSAGAGDSTFAEENGALVMRDIQIAEGAHVSGAKLGLVRETTLSGLVWLDSDGVTVPVQGAKVTLVGDDDVSVVCITGADGVYTFAGLMPGDYAVSVVLPDGYAAIEPEDRRLMDGTLVSILETNSANTGMSGVIAVKMGEHQLKMDIGSVLPGRLGDFCWLDLNANGLQDGDESGIPGVTIELVRNGATVAATTSDQYGYYVFENLYPGEYTLHVTAPAEVKPTQQRTDLPLIVSVLGEDGMSIPVAVESDGVNYAADLGFVLLNEHQYPAGYGEGAQQVWTFDR